MPERLTRAMKCPEVEMPPEEPIESQTLKYKDELLIYFYAWKTNLLEDRR